jgi:hypothetical protein
MIISLKGRAAQELFLKCWLKLHHRLYIQILVLRYHQSKEQPKGLQTSIAAFQTRRRLAM